MPDVAVAAGFSDDTRPVRSYSGKYRNMTFVIRNGHIITATDSYRADILCKETKIAAIGHDLPVAEGVEVIDASGKYVFPGFIDPHVHIYLPFMGTFAKDDYETATRAALIGGTTTLIEMCCPHREQEPLEAFELWLSKAAGLAACDYSFHMGVSRFDHSTEAALKRIIDQGIASFKVFLAYKDVFGISDTELFKTLQLARDLGVIVTAHCENETLVKELQHKLLREGKTGPQWHEPSRPISVEAAGVQHLMTFAELTGAHVYIVHTSCRPGVEAALAARRRGINVWIETVIPYLVLDDSYAQRPGFEGAKYIMSPPIRDQSHQAYLWNAIRTGEISTVATDHAPFDFRGQKEMGRDDFTKIPNGIPTVQHRVDLLYSYGVKTDRLDLCRFVDCASTQAAKIFGLFPRKGTIAVGSDADLVVYDPEYLGEISSATHEMATDYSAFEGWPLNGRSELVTVRGHIQVRGGKFVGKIGHGEFLKRSPAH
jgi:dihydropyrimidinase